MVHHASRVVVEAVGQFDGSSSFTCISVSQSLIYLGTRQGSLFLLSYSRDPVHENLSLLRRLSLGSSPVDVIFVLTGIGLLLVLCDGSLFLVDSLLTQAARRLGPFKGISAVGRRFRGTRSVSTDLVANSATSLKGQGLFEKLGGPVRANGTKPNESEFHREGAYVFAISIGKRLLLIELVDESFVVLQEMPCVDGIRDIVWLDDTIFIGTMDGYSLFSCVTGQSGVIFSLPDSCNRPLLKLLQREERVLLLVDNVGVIVDANGQPVGGSLVFHRAPESVAELSSYIVAAGDGKMDLYHKKSGSCIQTVTFSTEGVGPCVVAVEETEPGQGLAVAMPEKVVCYQKVPSEEQIKDLLRKKKFKEAVALMEELKSEGELSKEMLSFVHAQVGFLLLFDLHFEEAVNHFLQSETMQPSEIFPFIMPDPNRWSLLVPRNRYWGLHPPPMPLEDVVDDGLMAIQRAIFLRKAGIETVMDENSPQSPPTRSQLLKSAIENMIRYLEISRCKDVNLAVKEGIDTLLMYLYRALNRVYDMETLASSPNSCIVEELEALLDGSGHLRTLAFLYASKGKVSKAVTIWRTLARNYSFGLWKEPESDNSDKGCLDVNENVMSGREIAATEAAKILEDSSDECLVLQHLGWIADTKPILAIQVLTSEKRTKKLSPDEVIAAIDPKNVEIYQRYLQWLIEDQDSNDSQIHTLYALSLSKLALEVFESEIRSKIPCHQMGEQSIAPKGSIFQNSVRERLQMFLESSDLYDPEEVLDLIERSELWLEKAILYRKLGQETLVLHILALKLRDGEAAEQYCAEIGRPDAYMKLLDMYLDPEDGKEPMFNAAVRLLHNHGESLDPLQVLERLSPDMPLQLASDTILRMLRARFHHYREGQIVHSLSRAVHVDARLGRLEERSRNVQINDESLCDSCHARLGTKLFAMYPDDSIVCYKCFRRLGESNSVSGRNFKQDILLKTGWLAGQ